MLVERNTSDNEFFLINNGSSFIYRTCPRFNLAVESAWNKLKFEIENFKRTHKKAVVVASIYQSMEAYSTACNKIAELIKVVFIIFYMARSKYELFINFDHEKQIICFIFQLFEQYQYVSKMLQENSRSSIKFQLIYKPM